VNDGELGMNGGFDAAIIMLQWVNRDESTSLSRIASTFMTLELQMSDSEGES
jgi:hypothetical protein